jgi:hypothetical protein
MGLILIVAMFIAYVLPVPFLIWGWVDWLRSEQRFVSPAWRGIVALLALILASAICLPLFLAALHARDMREGPTKYSLSVMCELDGVAASIVTLALALLGKGPARVKAACASLSFALFFMLSNPYH